MSSIKRNKIILCAAALLLIVLACANVVLNPFNSFELRRQGRFEHSARVPILMYHHFADDGDPYVTISADAFELQIKALKDAGYTAITFNELCDFVNKGASLPERPVLITIDDGYMSVYETAYPILKKYGMKATVFIIGVFHGKSLYRDNPYWKIIPHFGDAEALEMVESGVMSIQSHSYNMHQYEPYEDDFRDGVLWKRGESRQSYIEAFTTDFEMAAAQIEAAVGLCPFVYSYPFGKCTNLSESLLKGMGVSVTLLTTNGVSTIIKDAPQSLFKLKRLTVSGDMTADDLLGMINGALKR